MDKFKLIFTFLRENISGRHTVIFLIAAFVIFMYKMLGFFGIVIGLLLIIGFDVCGTTNLKKIIKFYKDYFSK